MKKTYVLMALALIGLTACGNRSNKNQSTENRTTVETKARPADCDPDQGYVWSKMNEDCVKLFEKGISMISVEKPDLDHVVYVLFNADSTKAEIFKDQKSSDILDRRVALGEPVWNVEDDDTKNVRKFNGDWVIEQRGKVIYMHTSDLGPIEARYQGSDGITRRLYWVDAKFYPEAGRATVKVDERTYDLKQYVTGSGYGYRNADADLRGKGYDAELTFTADSLRNLKLRDVRGSE